jgi:diacylglycerol kinase (ATP)
VKKKICFIVNPISGVGRQKVIEKLIDERLNKQLFDYEIAYTKASKHATELSKHAAEQGFDTVVAVGGDGSINEIARGLIGTSTSMAIIPTGSGNGLARHLQIPLHLHKAMDVINAGKESVIDTMQLNNEIFVNVAGIGFDAHVGWEFAKFGKRGFSSYLKVIGRELSNFKVQDFELSFDGKTIQCKAFLITFANGTQWGNNAHIAPVADIADGIMDIAILKQFSFFNIFSIAYKLFTKSLSESSYIEFIRTKEVLVKQVGEIAHIDGEPIKTGKNLSIKVKPLSLKVIVP